MHFRVPMLVWFTALLLTFGAGCQKSESQAVVPPTILSPDTIASIHWLGKRQLGYEATAYFLMRIWNFPQTAQLERQAFNRLATVPERFFPGGTNIVGPPGALMLPLIYDLQSQESYLEIRQPLPIPSPRSFSPSGSRIPGMHNDRRLVHQPYGYIARIAPRWPCTRRSGGPQLVA